MYFLLVTSMSLRTKIYICSKILGLSPSHTMLTLIWVPGQLQPCIWFSLINGLIGGTLPADSL